MLKSNLIPTTQNFDVQALYETDVSNAKFKELIVRLAQYVNQISANLNTKPSGAMNTQEFNTGATFPSGASVVPVRGKAITQRSIFGQLVMIGTLPKAATSPKSVAHGIGVDSNFTLVRVCGSATDPIALRSIPFPNSKIDVLIDDTNVVISVAAGTDYTAYTRSHVYIEYIKN